MSVWEQPIPESKAKEVLQSTIETLSKAQRHYLSRFEVVVSNLHDNSLRERAIAFQARMKQNLHTLILHSLPRQRLQKALTAVMSEGLVSSLHNDDPTRCLKDYHYCHCRLDLGDRPWEELHDVGLGGLLSERAFAHAMHNFLQGPAIERPCFRVEWNGNVSVVRKLKSWVSNIRRIHHMILFAGLDYPLKTKPV